MCQHRFPPIAGLTAFRGAVTGDVGNVLSGTQQQVAFSRGTSGFVAINNEDVVWTGSFATGLPAGNYCNVFEGARNATGDCAASFVAVDASGAAALSIAPRAAVALYVGAEAPEGATQPAPTTPSEPPSTATAPSTTAPGTSAPSSTPAPSTPSTPSAPGAVTFSVAKNTTFGDVRGFDSRMWRGRC